MQGIIWFFELNPGKAFDSALPMDVMFEALSVVIVNIRSMIPSLSKLLQRLSASDFPSVRRIFQVDHIQQNIY